MPMPVHTIARRRRLILLALMAPAGRNQAAHALHESWGNGVGSVQVMQAQVVISYAGTGTAAASACLSL